MSDSPSKPLSSLAKQCPPTEEPSPSCLTSTSTITSFQILNAKLSSPPTPSPHRVDYGLLFAEKISPLHRLKLLKWLHSQAVKQGYYRQVFAYAASYLDRFLSLAPKVPSKDLQVLAFGALMLATKIQGVTFPRLGSMFDTNQILDAEMRIASRLSFYLHPRTYVQVLSELIGQWQDFVKKEGVFGGEQYLAQSSLIGFQRYRAFFEKMECVFMAPQSHRFPLGTLALNLFFLQNKINIEDFHPHEQPSDSLADFIRDSYDKLDQYGFIFLQFLLGRPIQDGKLDLEVGLYISNFICLPVEQQVPNRKCINYNSFLRMQTSSEPAIVALTKFAKEHN